MRTRRTGLALALAAVSLGATITSVSVPAAAATPVAGLPRAVALQVRYPAGNVKVWCVPYRDGMTGADVLTKADPTYGTGPYAGFVLQIGGKGSVPPTDTKYWAYWRSTTGRAADYAYSAAGVTSTHPPLRSVETWVWNHGSTTKVPKKSFATLCPGA